ncbi:5'-tyrosyl-DNA phosphodiesterase [Podospora fimiseda]|uniref:5'-tyrosyl-DNA phosphodiesterase n=1 Tax=Podospora fimiseda TaxID=252190 RepID=A0AAN7BSY6_9PEZI|nr:5'-tyrosyl-DNA phosphodiesterase [Podospora fimiseda]
MADNNDQELESQKAYQPYYTFLNDVWKPVSSSSSLDKPTSQDDTSQSEFLFSILSWNIDFQREFSEPRMKAALNHVHSLLLNNTPNTIIVFQEMEEVDLRIIQQQQWVRDGFWMTDLTKMMFWGLMKQKGTVMLISKSLNIKNVFRVHYDNTEMQRDGLFVDVELCNGRLLRVCTTHLESLRAKIPKRLGQMTTTAKYLKQADVGVVAGDMNAIQDFDSELPKENGLKDAYLESGGVEGDEGMTWGQMAFKIQRKQFGLTRMDKVLYCGRWAELKGFGWFGEGVEVEGEDEKREMMEELGEELERPWVTDHLGVRGDFRIVF